MSSRITLLIGLCAALLPVVPVQAQSRAVYYGNGIWVLNEWDATASLEDLKDELRLSMSSSEFSDTRFDVAYNRSLGHISDLAETARQIVGNEYPSLLVGAILRITGIPRFLIPAAAEQQLNDLLRDEAAQRLIQGGTSSTDVAIHVAKYGHDVDAGRNVVVVAHSQGNLFVNLAFDDLSDARRSHFAMVPVASPDVQSKKSLVGHVTFLNDSIINLVQALRAAAGLPLALFGNDFAQSPGTVWAHEFSENYLADASARDFIVNGVINSLEQLPPGSSSPSGNLVVNTGAGPSSPPFNFASISGPNGPVFGGGQWGSLAGVFTLNQSLTIGSVKGWMLTPNNPPGSTLHASIYSNIGSSPGQRLFTSAFTLAAADLPSWQGPSGLSWSLGAGTYWVVFEGTGNDTGTAAMLLSVPSPLLAYKSFTSFSGAWITPPVWSAPHPPLGFGVQISTR